MNNQVIQLIKPKTFEVTLKHVELLEDHVIVRPTYLSICHADQRYYKGLRAEEVLKKKLPMALIHEAIGTVLHDPTGKFSYGERVVLVPNFSGKYFGLGPSLSELNEKIGENYCPNGKFRSSGYDGFMQEVVSQPAALVMKAPANIPSDLLAITELVSVCAHAVKRFGFYSHGVNESFGIWGDGNIAYILALYIRKSYPQSKITVFGKHRDKMNMFSFVDEKYLIHSIPTNLQINHFFECVGGEIQASILNRMIELILPGGTISALGVSETNSAIDIRLMMEKGLLLVGDSRSGVEDFEKALQFMQDEEVISYLRSLINTVESVTDIKDINKVFELDSLKHFGKTVMKWEI